LKYISLNVLVMDWLCQDMWRKSEWN